MVQQGMMTEEQARQSSFSNIITRALGIRPTVDVEVNTRIVLPIVSEEYTITASIPIAMKVIQGKIPDYYMNGFNTKSNIPIN